MNIKISETDKERIISGELACVVVAAEFFESGDYTAWEDDKDAMKDMKNYDSIVIYSDGMIYGHRAGVSYDIDYNNFDDVETFIKLSEKYGIQDVEFP